MNVETQTQHQAKEHERFEIEIAYNGVTKPFHVEDKEQVSVLLKRAIEEFHIAQNPHMLSLYRRDGSMVSEQGTVGEAHLNPCELLVLRQNAVKGGAEQLRLPHGHLEETFALLRRCGRQVKECVVYWTGPANGDLVDGVEHPDHRASSHGYQIDDRWLTEFSRDLALSQRSVKAQLHTHPGRAFHSETDDRWPIVAQEGFLSIVIPDFATGEPTLDAAWIGRLGADGRWRRLEFQEEAFHLA